MVEDVAAVFQDVAVAVENKVFAGCGDVAEVEDLVVENDEEVFGRAEFDEGEDLG